MRLRFLAVTAVLLAGVELPSVASPPDSIAKQFLGTWRLVSTEQRLADGARRPNPLFGPNALGYLMYTETHMCAVLADPSRSRWTSERTPTEQEVRVAFNGFVAYCGPWEVDGSQGLVIHHVEIDKTPGIMGTLRKRYFTFSGDRLVLRLAPPLPEGVVEYSLTWERVKK
jgi:hypothetical protein